MSAIVPRKVMAAVPSPPATNVRPVVWARFSVPLAATRSTSMGDTPASTSLTAMTLAPENTTGVFSPVVSGPGTVFTGASLTAVTVKLKLCPASTFVPSSRVKVKPSVAGLSLPSCT